MALTPIQIFQPQTSIVGRMLAGGTSVFSDALQGVMNIGRDMVNNQNSQERSFLAERRNADALDLRKAQQVRSMFESDRAYETGVARDERDFGQRVSEDERDFTFRQNQADAMDQDRDASRDLSKRSYDLAAEDNKLAREKFDFEKADKEAQTKFNRDLLPEFGPQQKSTPGEDYATAQIEMDAAKAARDADGYKAAATKAARAKALFGDSTTEESPATRERLEIAKRAEQRTIEKDTEAKAAKVLEANETAAKQLVDDTTAFAPQLPQQELKDGKYTDPKAAGAAEIFDKDRFASERAVATGSSKDEFIAKGGKDLSDRQKAKRAQFWDLVNGKAAAAAPSATSSYIKDAAKKLE